METTTSVKSTSTTREFWTPRRLFEEIPCLLDILKSDRSDDDARQELLNRIQVIQLEHEFPEFFYSDLEEITVRDCARSLRAILKPRNEQRTSFPLLHALRDIANEKRRSDLSPAFIADITHLFRGLLRNTDLYEHTIPASSAEGREAAILRSEQLDDTWNNATTFMSRYKHGLMPDVIEQRKQNRDRILKAFSATHKDWNSWRWQFRHIARTAEQLEVMTSLSTEERDRIQFASAHKIPFGVTPFYASLMDTNPNSTADRAVRAQVIPPAHYLKEMAAHRHNREQAFDFMLERETSPIDLITRRYPAIVILKPYNTCPQICVYCQRNWEIEECMAPKAMADKNILNRAIDWIREHKAICEVLVTGGDTLAMSDKRVLDIVETLAEIDHIERIRIGTRVPVTAPMRITHELAKNLSRFRIPGRREICVVTHVEHPYEINPDMAKAVDLLRRAGISVYNQQVYTFYVSRRFETALLRQLLRRCQIDPYYTFSTKGKEETSDYRVPLARILQEQKEEARLLPGLSRTDEAVYNVPGLGKNYIRAWQHHDLIGILPDGSRYYEFHPWEEKVLTQKSYLTTDIPILDYLERLRDIGEDPAKYESIWYYY